MKTVIPFKQYILNYYYKPLEWMSQDELSHLQNQLDIVNKESGKNFNYGIFDPHNRNNFYKNSMICVMELDGHPAGFFYNVIFEGELNIVHQGLVLISKNIGENLLYFPYVNSNKLIREKIGDFYITSISSVPSIIGEIHNIFDNVYPSPFVNQIKPPQKEYSQVALKVFEDYVKRFFPFPEEVSFNKRRFVIESKAKEMGFERDIRNLPRDSRFEVNVFCQYWLDYSKNEDIIQVGIFNQKTEEKNKV